jgi:hypothetical protein
MKRKNFLMCLLAVLVVLPAGLFALPSSRFKGDFKWVKYNNKDCGYSIDCPQGVTVITGGVENSMGMSGFLFNNTDIAETKIVPDCTFEAHEGNNVVHFRVYVFKLEKWPENFELRTAPDGDLMKQVKVNGRKFTYISRRDSAMGMTDYNDLYIINAGSGTSWCVAAEYFYSHRNSCGTKEFMGICGYEKMNAVFMRMLKSFKFGR